MRRTLWFAAGAGAGLYASLRARRAAEALSVEGLQDRVGAAVVGLRMFRQEVAQGKAEAETQLRQRMGVALTERERRLELAATEDTPDNDEQEAGSS